MRLRTKLLFGCLLFAALCEPALAKLNVVATTADLASIAKAIGGDLIDLTILAKPTEDPHFVDAKPSLILKLNRADVVIEGGAELEAGWLTPLLEGARNPKLEAGRPGRIRVCATPADHGRVAIAIADSVSPIVATDEISARPAIHRRAELAQSGQRFLAPAFDVVRGHQ